MSTEAERLRQVLASIGTLAMSLADMPTIGVVGGESRGGAVENEAESDGEPSAALACIPKALPTEFQVTAAATAVKHNPQNAPAEPQRQVGAGETLDPLAIAVMTTKYWGPRTRRLTVSFLEPTSQGLRNKILAHLNAWDGGITFHYTQGTGNVRIAFGPTGYWSYVGTDVLHIPAHKPTMNLQAFTESTPESEYRRVVRHEGGHTLGFPHEHMRKELIDRIDREKAYTYFGATQGWSRSMVDQQVLTPLSSSSIFGTPSDQTSIMCYQLPASITKDGRPILGGKDINRTDRQFNQRIYPKINALNIDPASVYGQEEAVVDESEYLSEPLEVDS